MREERLRILAMLQEGKITSEEAERLLAALSGTGRSESGEWSGRGRRPRNGCDFGFDFTRYFDPRSMDFGHVFDEDFRRKFREKMRGFRHSMRWADEESRKDAAQAMQQAAEAVRAAMEKSNIKETVESIGKSVLDAMEEVTRRFRDSKHETGGAGASEQKPDGGGSDTTA